MRTDIILWSLFIVIAFIIWAGGLFLGIRAYIRGRQTKIKQTRILGIVRIMLASLISFFLFIPGFAFLYTEFLWFNEMGYASVFWKMLLSPWFLFLRYALLAGAFLGGNMVLASRLCPTPGGTRGWAADKTGLANTYVIILIVSVSIIMGAVAIPMWDDYQRHYNQVPFSTFSPDTGKNELVNDPQFDKNITYFLISLPVHNFTSLWIKALLWIAFIYIALLYRFYGSRDSQSKANLDRHGIYHISALWILVLGTSVWRSFLNIHRLLYANRGAVFGAGITDIRVLMPGYYIYIVIVTLVAITVIINLRLRKKFLITVPIVLWFLSYVIIIWVIPGVYQYVWVTPNESIWEKDYITRNIEYTRIAYDLHRVKVSELVPEVATMEKVKDHPETLKNVQLWDRRAVRSTFSQDQVFRPYYVFWDVDVDRYHLTNPKTGESEYRQVMITARELDSDKLPTRTWGTLRLIYTHGYGVCLGAVNRFKSDGKPDLWIEGVPPKINHPGFKITRPEIYYGEVTDEYVFVNTGQPEFDFPEAKSADKTEDRYTKYEGRGGIELKSIFRRLSMAIRFRDFRIITSNQLKPESRIMFNRQISDRSRNLAPFLLLDRDPYIVIGESGRLWWIIDAYVSSRYFPYSEWYPSPMGKINYIRNPIKAVIDAYDGRVSFYMWDENEALTQVYNKMFPGLLKSRWEMPDGLEKHNRYPDDLTSIQAEIYCKYHMEDPQTFYAKGDQWELPYEVYYQDREIPVVPLYVMIRLPGHDEEEFVSIIPFTPYPTKQRPNMVAWMGVRNDEPNYGELLVYIFPKGESIPGPAQIESRIDTNPEISAMLTLWNEGGSRVIRGNLLVIPIDNAIFYVEPLYLETEMIKMPLLTQVTVAAGDKVVWAKNFDLAINKLFDVGERIETMDIGAITRMEESPKSETPAKVEEPQKTETPTAKTRSLLEIVDSAKKNYSELKKQIDGGKTEDASKTLKALESDINALETIIK